MAVTWCIDEKWDAVHIFFDSIPEVRIREKMKSLGFKWHKRDKYWFARQNPKRISLAKKLCGNEEPKPENERAKPEKTHTHGVQVGDIFSMSWGYDQTQVDFFQVVKLCGEKSCRIRGVIPKVKERKPESGMSETTIYDISRDILEPTKSVFIKDMEKGDLKRIDIEGAKPRIWIDGHIADIEPIGETSHFTSWWR